MVATVYLPLNRFPTRAFFNYYSGGGANAPPVPLGGTKISNNKNAYRQIC